MCKKKKKTRLYCNTPIMARSIRISFCPEDCYSLSLYTNLKP